MDQQPAPLPHTHQTSVPPPPDCGANPALREPLPWPPSGFDASYFTCITPPYGTRAAPNFANCCDSQVANFTEVHLTSEGPSSCAAYCSVKPDRLLVVDYRASDFHTCLFGGEEADSAVELECWDGQGVVGDLDWEDRFQQEKRDVQHEKRNARPQEDTEAPVSTTTSYDSSFWSSLIAAAATDTAAVSLPVEGITQVSDATTTYDSTTTYDPSFWSSLISAAATDTASITLPTAPGTPVLTTNGTAAATSEASSVTGSFVSVSEISGTNTDSSASSTAGSSSAAATSAADSGSSTTSAGASAPTSGAEARVRVGCGKWMCTGLVLSAVFAALS